MNDRPRERASFAAGVAAGIVLLAVLAAAILPALAHDQDPGDGNDTGGRLDVRWVEHRHKNPPFAWSTITFGRWTARRIWDQGFVLVYLDTFGDEDADYYALLRSNGSRMLGLLYRIRRGHLNRRIDNVRVWRRHRSDISVTIPFRKLNIGAQRESYRWSVLTIFQGGACPRNCFDFVPNQGSVEQFYATTTPPSTSPPPTTDSAPAGGGGDRTGSNDVPQTEGPSPAGSSSPTRSEAGLPTP